MIEAATESPRPCSCKAGGTWMSRCAMHGWRGKAEPAHVRWLLEKYPKERAEILNAALKSSEAATTTENKEPTP